MPPRLAVYCRRCRINPAARVYARGAYLVFDDAAGLALVGWIGAFLDSSRGCRGIHGDGQHGSQAIGARSAPAIAFGSAPLEPQIGIDAVLQRDADNRSTGLFDKRQNLALECRSVPAFGGVTGEEDGASMVCT